MVDDIRIISTIEELSARGYPPTFRELMRKVGLRSSCTIKVRLEKLRRAGYVDWEPRQPQTLRVVRRVKLCREPWEDGNSRPAAFHWHGGGIWWSQLYIQAQPV